MSAMSASSPPAGLRGLSLIAEHKSSVPPTVQPLPRTPEKLPLTQQPPSSNLLVPQSQPQAQALLPSQPTSLPAVGSVEASKQTMPLGVANGMELSQPPVSFPSTEVPPHQTAAMETTPTLLPPPPAHLPNLPCGSKGELDRGNDVPPISNQDNNGGEVSESAEAPAPDFSQQPPASAATIAAPNHQPAVPFEPIRQEPTKPAQASPGKPPSPKQPSNPPQTESQEIPPVENSIPPTSDSKPTETQSEKPVESAEPSSEIPPPVSTDKTEKSESAEEIPSPPEKESEDAIKPENEAPAKTEEPKAEPPAQTRTKRQPKPPAEKKKKPESAQESSAPNDDKSDADEDDKDKPKRKRRPTEPYQSWNSERTLIAQISKTIEKVSKPQPQNEKLIVFYRNEFLAVRSVEGGFYICQAMQNIYRTSQRIKIRWLSQETNSENYKPDFYDHTEFDCILTNLNLERIGKDKFKLPEVESQRTQSILKRAMDVEKGVAGASDGGNITEEHPDGLDLSLYRNEDQLKKRKKGRRKGSKKKIVAEVSSVKRAALARVIKKRGVGASSTDRGKATVTVERKPAAAPSRTSSRRGVALAKRKAFAEAASKRAAAGISTPGRRGAATASSTASQSKQTAASTSVGTVNKTTSATKRKASPASGATAPSPVEKRARLAGKTRSGTGAANTANAGGSGSAKAASVSNNTSAAGTGSATAVAAASATSSSAAGSAAASAGGLSGSAAANAAAASGAAGTSTVTRRTLRNAK